MANLGVNTRRKKYQWVNWRWLEWEHGTLEGQICPLNSRERPYVQPCKYGVIQDIQEESWSKQYRYVVVNGIRIVMMPIQKHLPSHINIAGCRALISYEGQPQTCYGCGATDHIYQVCPKRQKITVSRMEQHGLTWAQWTAARPSHIESNDKETQSNQTVAAQTTARQTDADCMINEEGESEQVQSTERIDTHIRDSRNATKGTKSNLARTEANSP
jgi:hypothetical protein